VSRPAASSVEVIADGIDHPEAVVWDDRRGVLFCGGEEGQLYAVGLDGSVSEVARTGGSLLGLALGGTGLVYACDAGTRSVVAIDPDEASVTTISTGVPSRPFIEPNGIAFDVDGSAYVTCSGHWAAGDGAIYRIDPGGQTTLWSHAVSGFPNGCLVHEGRLLVVESHRPRIVAVVLAGPSAGVVAAEVCRLPDTVPDQIALDVDGGLTVGCYRPDLVLHVDARGELTERLRDPSGMTLAAPTGCTYAGPDLDLLVVSNYGGRQLLALTVPERGTPVIRPRVVA
jgi:gluconolactonase